MPLKIEPADALGERALTRGGVDKITFKVTNHTGRAITLRAEVDDVERGALVRDGVPDYRPIASPPWARAEPDAQPLDSDKEGTVRVALAPNRQAEAGAYRLRLKVYDNDDVGTLARSEHVRARLTGGRRLPWRLLAGVAAVLVIVAVAVPSFTSARKSGEEVRAEAERRKAEAQARAASAVAARSPLRGKSFRDAVVELKARKLYVNFAYTEVPADAVAQGGRYGHVWSTTPDEYEALPQSQHVCLNIAVERYDDEPVVPTIQPGMPMEDVIEALVRAQIVNRIDVRPVVDANVPVGGVVSLDVAPGTRLPPAGDPPLRLRFTRSAQPGEPQGSVYSLMEQAYLDTFAVRGPSPRRDLR